MFDATFNWRVGSAAIGGAGILVGPLILSPGVGLQQITCQSLRTGASEQCEGASVGRNESIPRLDREKGPDHADGECNDDERGRDQKPRWHFRLVVLNFLSHSVPKTEPPRSSKTSRLEIENNTGL
jgi:hypothetical protein